MFAAMKSKNTTISPAEALQLRMQQAYKELKEIACKKTEGVNAKLIYAQIAVSFKVTGQTVENYVKALSKNGNGYFIDALIKEFKKLPNPPKIIKE